MSDFRRIVVIQTAFIGDVILATSIVEQLHHHYPEAKIDLLVRKGNEKLVKNHPYLHHTYTWDKQAHKYKNLRGLLKEIKKSEYDLVINLQRYAATGYLTAFSKAKMKIGFKNNPFSFLFDQKVKHSFKEGMHEIERNNFLIADFTSKTPAKPKLYPSEEDYEIVKRYQQNKYITISPCSVWYTKQFPEEKWIELIKKINNEHDIYLLGGPDDFYTCQRITEACPDNKVANLAGKLSFLPSAAFMEKAVMNYTNDSAPLHIASAMNAPLTAIFCSTSPKFGFGPISKTATILETKEELNCRPCGVHGKKSCPKGHFKCAHTIYI